MTSQSSVRDMLRKEEVRTALWNTVLPTTREVDPVLWDSVVELVEEKILAYLKECPRQQAKKEELEVNVGEKEGPPASFDQVISYLIDTKVLIPVGVFQLEKVAVRETCTNFVQSVLSSTVNYSFGLLKQTCKPVLRWWTDWGDDAASTVLTHKCLLEVLVNKLWCFVEEQRETHIGGRFLVQELCSVFSGDEVLCHRSLYALVQQGKAVVYEVEKDVFGVKFGPDLSIKEFDKNIFSLILQITRLERHIDSLNLKLSKVEESLSTCAKRMSSLKRKSSGSQSYMDEKRKGIQLLRIRKFLESSIDRSYQQLSNLNEILYSSEATELSQQAAQVLKLGRDAMNSLKEDQGLDMKEVDDVLLDLQEHMEDQQEIDDILAGSIMTNSDEMTSELEEDLNVLEASIEEKETRQQREASESPKVNVAKTITLPTFQREDVKEEKENRPFSYMLPSHS
ncbi:hypothetical protein Gasu2_00510 [Galdieria sulphuraria]|uniref:Charged multivesicular body protein 7 n=1 Tax=Galdieria sulphuraria TaxID=130081 RepID=M2XSK2_GALSU|nr:uncharacterized protein Gasu_56720 [Galdieria sulphuraria]EME26663.1 hypothetical protein Gasu_56720 [Galdieria sulphuraria]GJD05590.1 hypothetical protein Gasu2_00510 [Galdieria sulphuraria]|eukprot:XP_005703183.1 hypothetical protein Gasu_56720 [Galdieria sulphuraria]